MAMTALTKSWQIVPNMTGQTTGAALLLDRQRALCGTAFGGYSISQNAWVVIRSSNGVTVSNSNLWLTTADLVFGNLAGTNARAWIILQNALGRQILIDYRGSNSKECFVTLSPSGAFSGGTTTAAPTAPDQIDQYGFTSTFSSTNAFVGTTNQHVWVSADGKQTMVVSCSSGLGALSIWIIGELDDAADSWANPCIMYTGTCGDTGAPTGCWGREIAGWSSSRFTTGEALPGVNGNIRAILEALDITPLTMQSDSPINLLNELSSTWDALDKMWFEASHDKIAGVLGYWPDIYPTFTPRVSPSFRTGDHVAGPTGVLRTWVKVDDMFLPWQGLPQMVVGL
jgi:hypothetical protein